MSSEETANCPIAIVGIGCMFPGARDVREFWQNVQEGRDCIGEVPESHWSLSDYFDSDPASPDRTYGRYGGFLDPVDFDPLEFGISPRDLETTDTTQLLGLAVAKAALDDAGYGPGGREFDRGTTSVILGVTGALELVVPLGARLGHPLWRRALRDAGVDEATAQDVVDRIAAGYPEWRESAFPGLLGNVAAGRIANRLDLKGTNCVVDAACASSLSALHLAMLELRTGRTSMALSGGLDTFNDIFMYMCFSKTPALSKTGHARPFDQSADGTTLGEGLGVCVLKRLADAERDGDRIYAVIRGIGSSSDGKGLAVYAPSDEGQSRALENAYADAGVSPSTVELVEAHGTGTRVGDAVEVRGLTRVFAGPTREGGAVDPAGTLPWCALGSVKSQIGHTKAAAGAAGLIKATLALHHRVLPPTSKIEAPNEAVRPGDTPFYVHAEPRPWVKRDHPRRAGVSSFGFGGTNFHCVLEEAPRTAPAGLDSTTVESVDLDGAVQILAFSGDSDADVRTQLDELERELGSLSDLEDARDRWREVRRFAQARRAAFDRAAGSARVTLVAEREGTALADLIAEARRLLDDSSAAWQASPRGVWLGRGEGAGAVALMFPGQGAQRVGMLRELACRFPEMRRSLDEANRAFVDEERLATGTPDHESLLREGERLSDLVFPPTAFTDDERERQAHRLRATQIAQPALGAVGLGAFAVLERFGLRPAAAAGHSYGELLALCAAGRLSQSALHRLSCLRGRLMGEGSGDRGSMLALAATLDGTREFLQRHGLRLEVANRNTPTQMVLSGATAEIDRAVALAEKDGLRARRLAVSAAFHSPLVASAGEPLAARLETIELPPGRFPAWSNRTGGRYPEGVSDARRCLAEQLASPVEFVRLVHSMADEGFRTFLEVGPGRGVSGMVLEILGDRPDVVTVALDESAGSRSGMTDLARALAQLAARGAELRLAGWDEAASELPEAVSRARRFTVRISGANLRPSATTAAGPRPAVAPSAAVPPASSVADPPAERGPAPEPSPHSSHPPQRRAGHGDTHPAGPVAPAEPGDRSMAIRDDLIAAILRIQDATHETHRRFLESQDRVLQQLTSLAGATGASDPGSVRPVDPVDDRAAAPVSAEPDRSATSSAVVAESSRALDAGAHRSADRPSTVTSSGGAAADRPATSPSPAPDLAVERTLLEVVAEKTGYPAEMLEVSMSLDADLGIDSIKRVEILSALTERVPAAAGLVPEDLGRLTTLEDVLSALRSTLPAAGTAPAPAAPAPQSAPAATAGREAPTQVAPSAPPEVESAPSSDGGVSVEAVLLDVVSEKTGYPSEMLDDSMSLDADLGIDSIKRVEILSALAERIPAAQTLAPEDLGRLQTLGEVVAALGAAPPADACPAVPPVTTDAAPILEAPATPYDDAGPSASGSATVRNAVLEVVSEKTGYPSEMLELDMGLDADLGIDSIKRVEILSALAERIPAATSLEPERLGELQTLADVVAVLETMDVARGTAAGPADVPPRPVRPAAPAPASVDEASTVPFAIVGGDVEAPVETLLEVVSEKTGYPSEMLELDMGLDADLGIDSIKRVEILSAMEERLGRPLGLEADRLGELTTLADVVAELTPRTELETAAERRDALATPGPHLTGAPVGEVERPEVGLDRYRLVLRPLPGLELAESGTGPLPAGASLRIAALGDDPLATELAGALRHRGLEAEVVDLASLDLSVGQTQADLAGLVLVAPPDPGPVAERADELLRRSFSLVRDHLPSLRRSASRSGGLLAAVTRLGGGFGLDDLDPVASEATALFGGLAGLLKTVDREAPELPCRVVDVAGGASGREVAAALLARGPVEIGMVAGSEGGSSGRRLSTPELSPASVEAPREAFDLQDEDVVLITGGGRGVTAEAAAALARAGARRIALLGRTPVDRLEPPELHDARSEPDLKRALLELALRTSRERLEPRELEARYRRVVAQREVRATLGRLTELGARAIYRSVDVRDPRGVAEAVSAVTSELGPISVLVHGAGVLADRKIEDKTEDDWRRVWDTKVAGLRAVLSALGEHPPLEAGLRALVLFSSTTARLGRRGQADYAAANEALDRLALREAGRRTGCRVVSVEWGPWQGGMVGPELERLFLEEGVVPIPLDEGARCLVHELGRADGDVVVSVLGAGSRLPEPRWIEPAAASAGRSASISRGGSVLADASTGPSRRTTSIRADSGPTLRWQVSVATHPFLKSHVINGRAVLPTAMIVEWMAHSALHGQPGLRFHGFDHLRVLKGVRVNGETVELGVETGTPRRDGSCTRVPTRLVSLSGEPLAHASAEMVLLDELPGTPAASSSLQLAGPSERGDSGDYFGARLFHGPLFHGIELVEGTGEEGVAAIARPAGAPSEWMESPLRGSWLADPLALDVGFQLMILWSQKLYGFGSLPAYIESYRQYVRRFPRERVRVEARVGQRSPRRAVADLEWTLGGSLLARMEGYECVIDGSLNEAFTRNRLLGSGRGGAS